MKQNRPKRNRNRPREQSAREAAARERAEAILKVRSGQWTATKAAAHLGVSRKTYYEWERRGLEGLLAGVQERLPGRPRQPRDEEKERLAEQVKALQNERHLANLKLTVNERLSQLPDAGRGKPTKSQKPSASEHPPPKRGP